MDLNTLSIAYNKDIFAKLGLKIPTTLDELLAMVPKIKAEGLQPMSLNAKDGWPNGDLWFSQLAYTDPNAKALRSAEAGKGPWDAPPLLTAATNVQKMQAAGLFSSNAASLDFVTAYTEFATGKSAMLYPVGNFGTPVIDSISKGNIKYGLFPFPPAAGGVTPRATGGAAIIWSIPGEDQERGRGTRARAGLLGPVRDQDAHRRGLHPGFQDERRRRTARRSTSAWCSSRPRRVRARCSCPRSTRPCSVA